MTSVAAIDLGATSGRVVVGSVDAGRLRLRPVARFPNTPVRLTDGLHWDVLSLYSAAMTGLGQASREDEDLLGAAVDGWAVDYGLLAGDRLLGNPLHYRDARTADGVRAVHAQLTPEDLYRRNGLQHLPFTTVFQLAAEARDGLLGSADRLLLVPDLIGWWATGTAVAERTNASTTGLLPVGGSDWDHDLLARVGVGSSLMPPIVSPGSDLGPIAPSVRDAFGIAAPLRLSTVGSHDTASAVVGAPLEDEGSAYISCGTWSLVGAELPEPVVTEDARRAGFTNEGGVDGRTRFLANVMGLWLLTETLNAWLRAGETAELGGLLRAAAEAPADVPVFDPDDPRLLSPADMPGAIRAVLADTGAAPLASRAAFVRSILASLAAAYARRIDDVERLTGRRIHTIHLVGGGAQNPLLCQLTADATGRRVLAGPVEATAIGNLLVQARTHGLIDGDLEALRRIVAASFPAQHYAPRPGADPRG